MLPLIKPDEPDDTLHIVRVRVARRRLKNERRLVIDERVCGRGQYRPRDHIDRNNVEDQLFVDGNYRLAAKRDQDERSGRCKAFVPARKRIRLRRFDDRRAHEHLDDVVLRSDDLLGQRFGIGVNIGPAPILGTLGAEFGRALADPHLAFAKDGRFQLGLVVRIAALFDKSRTRLLAELGGLDGVVRLLTCLFAQAGTVLDLAIDVKRRSDKLVLTRKIADDRFVFPDRPAAFARHKTRRNVNDARFFHHSGKFDDVV